MDMVSAGINFSLIAAFAIIIFIVATMIVAAFFLAASADGEEDLFDWQEHDSAPRRDLR